MQKYAKKYAKICTNPAATSVAIRVTTRSHSVMACKSERSMVASDSDTDRDRLREELEFIGVCRMLPPLAAAAA